jgi:hypothetical protein
MTEQAHIGSKIPEGKVAAILNARELVINIGSAQGVDLGMRFKVLAETPVAVTDPDTFMPLGVIDREKVRVQTVEVQENLSVCKTYQTRRIGGQNYLFGSILGQIGDAPRTVVETLKADEASFPPPLSEAESYVKLGDRVVPLTTDELRSK